MPAGSDTTLCNISWDRLRYPRILLRGRALVLKLHPANMPHEDGAALLSRTSRGFVVFIKRVVADTTKNTNGERPLFLTAWA